IRANKIKILSEWTNMKQNFKQKEKRSSETIALSFDLFSEALFNEDLSKDDLLKIIKENWEQKIDSERSEEHTSELQSRFDIVCRLLLEKKKENNIITVHY